MQGAVGFGERDFERPLAAAGFESRQHPALLRGFPAVAFGTQFDIDASFEAQTGLELEAQAAPGFLGEYRGAKPRYRML